MDTNLVAQLAHEIAAAKTSQLNTILIALLGVITSIAGIVASVKIAKIQSLAGKASEHSLKAFDGIVQIKQAINGERAALQAELSSLKLELTRLSVLSSANAATADTMNLKEEIRMLKEQTEDLKRSRVVDEARRQKLLQNAARLDKLVQAPAQ